MYIYSRHSQRPLVVYGLYSKVNYYLMSRQADTNGQLEPVGSLAADWEIWEDLIVSGRLHPIVYFHAGNLLGD
jgi:hypothetical protein